MATIGQALTAPESGWKRYNDNNTLFTYSGNYTYGNNATYYYNLDRTILNENGKITFSFTGDKLRIIGVSGGNIDSTSVSIFIDEKKYDINPVALSPSIVYQSLVFEVNSLPNQVHNVRIENNQVKNFAFDAIDIDINGELTLFKNYKRLAVKNPTTDEHYSLADNTLIHLPDNSNKNMILHGIEQGKEIQLDVPFDKHRYFNDTPVDGTSGKVFTHDIVNNIGKINTLNIKELRESNFVPIYDMLVTSMTSNTAPTPFVASASSTHTTTTFQIWKAFNGTNIDSDDAWISSGGYANGLGSEWIQIDFGETKIVNTLFLTHRVITTGYSPKKFEILGSNNGVNFDILHTVDNAIDWGVGERRIFTFNNTQGYRYFRLKILEVNSLQSGAYVQIGGIQYGYKGEVK